jgi:hypothetical protein
VLRGYSVGRKLAPVRAAKGLTDLRRYLDSTRFSSNSYFFFFLADFFFFAFFAFLAILPSVTPKLAQCKSTFDMHTFRVHHNCKIDTARFEEGKRPPHPRDLRPGRSLRVMRGHIARCWIKARKKFSCGRKTKSTTGSLTIPWLIRPHGGSVKGNSKVRARSAME